MRLFLRVIWPVGYGITIILLSIAVAAYAIVSRVDPILEAVNIAIIWFGFSCGVITLLFGTVLGMFLYHKVVLPVSRHYT